MQNEPAAHVPQTESFVALATALQVPAAQQVKLEELAGQNAPAGHAVGEAAPAVQ
jgi:hypothetical protein